MTVGTVGKAKPPERAGEFIGLSLYGFVPYVELHIRDKVMILRGPRKRKIAEVYEVWDSRGQVRLRLSDEECEAVADVFSYYEVLRVKEPNPQGGANGRQPSGSDTNRTSAAAASRRSP